MPRVSSFASAAIAVLLVLLIAAPSRALAAGTSPVTIVNGTRTVMVSLQLRPSGGAWTEILDRNRLSVHQEYAYPLPPGDCDHYDIRAVFDDGHVVNKTDQKLCNSPYVLTDF
jgi:hypothetical protein